MFGELSAIDGQARCASVIAVTDTLVASMTKALFWETMRQHESVSVAILCRLTRLVRRLSERVVEFSTLGVRNRIHAELLRLAREATPDHNVAVIFPAPTHSDIASRVSTHREAVTRELNDLARAGLIRKTNGTIVIHDVAALAQMVQEVLGE
jgi:CRP-like cAMP-binding protein